MRRHLPRGRWSAQLLSGLDWRRLAELARYPYRRSKKAAKRRIHKLERAEQKRDLRQP